MSITLVIFAVSFSSASASLIGRPGTQPRRAIFTLPTVGSRLPKTALPLPETGAVRLRFSDLPD